MALPATIILLAVIGVIGTRIYLVMAILGVLISAGVYRVMLGVAQSVRQRLYVDAARVNGLGSLRVNLVHVLPSMATVAAVQAAQLFGIGLLIQAGLAFLGLRPGRTPAELGLHDPGRVEAHLRLAVAAGAHRPRARASPWSRPTSSPTRSPARRRPPMPLPVRPRRLQPRRSRRARRRPADPTAVLEVRDLSVSVDDGPALVTERLLHPAAGPGARPGRRVRLRQDDDRPVAAGPAAGRRLGVRRVDPLAGPRAGRAAREPAQRRPRPGDRDDLPGADGRAGPDVLRSPTSSPSRSAGSAASAAPRPARSPPSCSGRSASSTPSGC